MLFSCYQDAANAYRFCSRWRCCRNCERRAALRQDSAWIQYRYKLPPLIEGFSVLFSVDLTIVFVIIYFGFVLVYQIPESSVQNGGIKVMATKTNFILKVQDSKLADVQKALKDANITVVSILEIHKEEA
jgi:hypothetical protein